MSRRRARTRSEKRVAGGTGDLDGLDDITAEDGFDGESVDVAGLALFFRGGYHVL